MIKVTVEHSDYRTASLTIEGHADSDVCMAISIVTRLCRNAIGGTKPLESGGGFYRVEAETHFEKTLLTHVVQTLHDFRTNLIGAGRLDQLVIDG